MSDEQRIDEEAEVEAHKRRALTEEPHEDESEVEAHIRYDKPKKD